MKKIKVLSIGDICSNNLKLNDDILVISFFNYNDFSIVDKQKYSIKTNPSILEFENNIFSLQKDDITKLSFYQKLKHNINLIVIYFQNMTLN